MRMGSSKIKGIFFIIILLTINGFALSFEEFQKQQQSNYQTYKITINDQFRNYKKAHHEAMQEFSSELANKWPDEKPEITTSHKWVEYSKDLNSKKSIDFEKKEIRLEVIASNEKEAKEKIAKMFDTILTKDVNSAYKDDILEQKILKKLKKIQKPIKSNEKLIANIISNQEKTQLKQKIKEQNLIVLKHKDKFIYKANVKLPSGAILKKAKQFKNDVMRYSKIQKVPAQLVYAIMHSESSFNPMARSHIPAFGLMQIVPRSAGIDSYQYLYNKKRILSSSYLYNSENNIKIGSAYIHILYYRYLKKIKDPQSRLYCTIAAYNTGAGNVAKAFIGSTNISRAALTINNMDPQTVYKTLMKKLPYNETKKYLIKVNDRVSAYNKLLKTVI